MTVSGTASGMALQLADLSARGMRNKPKITDVKVNGKDLSDDIIEQIVSADVEMAVDQVTEIAFTIDDPDFKILASGKFDLNTPVTYRGLHLSTAAIETSEGGGLGGITVRCRPLAVRKLKRLRGPRTLHHVTPAMYLRSECEKAGIAKKPLVQKSAKKKKIARDVREDGVKYDPSDYPSAWTTIRRIADEIGYYLYEIGGTIVLGQPTWLVKHQPIVEVQWYPENGKEPYAIPEFRQSEDSRDLEFSLSLPLERAGDVYPGVGIKLTSFPKYSGTYFINRVAYPLVGDGVVTVDASTIRNPEPAGTGSTSTYSFAGEWVNDADKVGDNCKFTPREMVDRAHKYIGQGGFDGRCEAFICQLGKGVQQGAGTAVEEWHYKPAGTQWGTEEVAPAGSVVCWANGANHIAMSIGGGWMITSGPTIKKMKIPAYMGMSGYSGWKYPNLHP